MKTITVLPLNIVKLTERAVGLYVDPKGTVSTGKPEVIWMPFSKLECENSDADTMRALQMIKPSGLNLLIPNWLYKAKSLEEIDLVECHDGKRIAKPKVETIDLAHFFSHNETRLKVADISNKHYMSDGNKIFIRVIGTDNILYEIVLHHLCVNGTNLEVTKETRHQLADHDLIGLSGHLLPLLSLINDTDKVAPAPVAPAPVALSSIAPASITPGTTVDKTRPQPYGYYKLEVPIWNADLNKTEVANFFFYSLVDRMMCLNNLPFGITSNSLGEFDDESITYICVQKTIHYKRILDSIRNGYTESYMDAYYYSGESLIISMSNMVYEWSKEEMSNNQEMSDIIDSWAALSQTQRMALKDLAYRDWALQ